MADDDSRPVPDPTTLTEAFSERGIAALREVLEARMDGKDRLDDERFKGIASALVVALAAAKELVSENNKSSAAALAKSESATEKQLDALGDKIDDLKERLNSQSWGYVLAAIAAVTAVIAVVIAGALIFK